MWQPSQPGLDRKPIQWGFVQWQDDRLWICLWGFESLTPNQTMVYDVTAAYVALTHLAKVQILVDQPNNAGCAETVSQ